ncbi:prion-inhibition and propagation-domain-containing protein [Echria macrotheca]|uniref:Prion-inhibition and propagation-domain-containing protein n=1 Tax=Echria macrotheca TaxID=438768 RepID=A0AAJ0BDQ8_9PEZI|nr:prion-inhibition and propagation-domain-containing protein [Echria macrotheca]
MDPVGLSLGAVSLVFQLFAGCVKAYKLLSEAHGLDKKYRSYLIRFKAEQFRLLDWATVAGLSDRDETGLISKINRAVIINILDEQHRLLMRFGRLDERLRPLAAPLLVEYDGTAEAKETAESDLSERYPQSNQLLRKALSFIDATSKYPSRLRWAFCDRAKADELLCRISDLNNTLRDLLNREQLQSLREQEQSTQYQIMQLNNKMDHLIEIVDAGLVYQMQSLPSRVLDWSLSSTAAQPRLGHAALEGLATVAKLKATVLSTEEGGTISSSLRSKLNLESSSSDISISPEARLNASEVLLDVSPPNLNNRSAGWFQPRGKPSSSRHRIWVEWTTIPPQRYNSPSSGPEARTIRRLESLVSLLRQSHQTAQLRAVPCVGYYSFPFPHHRASQLQLHYGLVYTNPPGVNPASHPVSLRHLISTAPRPGLAERLLLMQTLAGCLARLHAVNWLHKGLRSENILFFVNGGSAAKSTDPVDMSDPYISGFDYARPAESASLSEAPFQRDLLCEIYRHPAVQGQAPLEPGQGGFRKVHDIYSLGLVMMEIAEWKTVDAILIDVLRSRGSHHGKLSGQDVLDARETLIRGLANPRQSGLATFVGGIAARAIWACIEGESLLGNKGDDEGAGGADLQARFFEAVSKPLSMVRV